MKECRFSICEKIDNCNNGLITRMNRNSRGSNCEYLYYHSGKYNDNGIGRITVNTSCAVYIIMKAGVRAATTIDKQVITSDNTEKGTNNRRANNSNKAGEWHRGGGGRGGGRGEGERGGGGRGRGWRGRELRWGEGEGAEGML